MSEKEIKMGERGRKIGNKGWDVKVFRGLIYALPAVLFFSYYPLIHFGTDGVMNYEISLPLLWLVLFDVVGLVMMAQRRMLISGWKRAWWLWLLFPVWLSLTVMWSVNPVRGLLTVGIWWLIMFAGYAMWRLRDLFDEGARGRFWRWFLGAALVVCAWCVIQCILDLAGVSREYSLMCEGCVYQMFGFPHPNGFAVEPQYMGNLLLAPAIMSMWLLLNKDDCNSVLRGRVAHARLHGVRALILGSSLRKPLRTLLPVVLCFILSATLFLTFSRGAIYAFGVAMMVMTIWVGVRKKTWRVLQIPGIVAVAFVFVLNMQGLMAQVSPTNESYRDGVARVLNQLSLGVIDIRGGDGVGGESKETNGDGELAPVEKPVENFVDNNAGNIEKNLAENEAVFDGYVAESTETRMKLTSAAVEVWGQNPETMMFGVGLGGAGRALYDSGLLPSPKEIVQNEYASLLLETGLVGILLLIVMVVLAVRIIWKSPMRIVMVSLLVAYAITLCFFSGLPNALHIYLLPVAMMMVGCKICEIKT